MLYVGVLNTEGLIADEGFLQKLPKEVRERVRSTKNEGEKRLRAGAYALLLELYKECAREHGLSAKMPEICYTGEGKPCFFANDSLHNVPKFSISHDALLSVVALSFGDEQVGVDVQSLPNGRVRLERVAERFLMPLRRLDVQFSRGESEAFECEDDISPTYSFYEIKNLAKVL